VNFVLRAGRGGIFGTEVGIRAARRWCLGAFATTGLTAEFAARQAQPRSNPVPLFFLFELGIHAQVN